MLEKGLKITKIGESDCSRCIVCLPLQVIVLFQRLNGVDVILYMLYMQEYGDDSLPPNNRWVYLSYLDSVKYFEPEIPSAIRPW